MVSFFSFYYKTDNEFDLNKYKNVFTCYNDFTRLRGDNLQFVGKCGVLYLRC